MSEITTRQVSVSTCGDNLTLKFTVPLSTETVAPLLRKLQAIPGVSNAIQWPSSYSITIVRADHEFDFESIRKAALRLVLGAVIDEKVWRISLVKDKTLERLYRILTNFDDQEKLEGSILMRLRNIGYIGSASRDKDGFSFILKPLLNEAETEATLSQAIGEVFEYAFEQGRVVELKYMGTPYTLSLIQ